MSDETSPKVNNVLGSKAQVASLTKVSSRRQNPVLHQPNELRIGVVGLGLAGAGMIPALVAHPNCSLSGAAELNETLRSRFAREFTCTIVDDIHSLVTRADIDAVYLATPHRFHVEHAVLAADHGKHVIVEKPMALTLEGCDSIIEAAERNGVTLIVGHTHGFDPAIGVMRNIISEGKMGRLAMIAMWNYTDFLYRPRRPEELDTNLGGGILYNQVPHQVDIARSLTGSELRSIRATAAVLDIERSTEGCCSALLDFTSGAVANLVYSGYDRFDSDEFHDWIGSKGQPKSPDHGATRRALQSIRGGDGEESARTSLYGFGGAKRKAKSTGESWHQPHFGTLIVTCEGGDMRPSKDGVLIYGDDGVSEICLPPSNGFSGRTEVLDELWNAVAHGIKPIHDGHFGRGTVDACLGIKKSAQERREYIFSSEKQP